MLKAVSLFAGAGGFCHGFKLAGWKVKCAVEMDPYACKTHAANFDDVALFKGNISRFLRDSQEGIPDCSDLVAQNIDAVYGGPPCQGFSLIGPRNAADPRNLLYKEFVRVVRVLKPRAFVMENVPNMLTMDGGRFRRKILSAFARAGYRRTAVVQMVASDYGVPQYRRRVFIFGLRDDLPFEKGFETTVLDYADKLKSKKAVTVREAISDLPEAVSEDDSPLPYRGKPGGRYSSYQKLMRLDHRTRLLSSAEKRGGLEDDELHNHHTKGVEARRKRVIRALRPGGSGDSLSAALWNGVRSTKWRRLHPDAPSYTILAQMHRDLSEWIHPKHDRWITVREAARLQSFHDGFVFHGSECQQLKQVGNAVPPLLGLAVARITENLLRGARVKAKR